jgi:hypothetical protein
MPQQIVNKCSSCFELIEKQQKHIGLECLACRKCFHEDITCVKSLSNYTNKNIDICQICLNYILPFQTLSNEEYELDASKSNLSEEHILNQLKFNPFKFNNDIALCDSNANLDHVLGTNRLKCNYYIPESLNKTQMVKILSSE